MIQLRFSALDTLAGRIIRWGTWSWCSHVDFYLPATGMLLGAVPGEGVSLRKRVAGEREAFFCVDAPQSVLTRAHERLGAKYDYSGVLGYALRRNWNNEDSWFCSELVAKCFEEEGVPLLRTDHTHRISPRDLLMSPHLAPAPRPGLVSPDRV